jgi:hypothetical protein
VEADLEERTRKFEESASAEYFLIIKTERGTQEIALGGYLKNCTKNDSPEYRKNLNAPAEKLGINSDPPTPALLQYFSSKPLTDEIKDGQRYNIHPIGEKFLLKKILEELAKLDPSITGEGPQQLTKIGSKELKGIEFARLKKIYKIFSGAQAL